MRILFGVVAVLFVCETSCGKSIDPNLSGYLADFLLEGERRGVNPDTGDLSIEFVPGFDDQEITGVCNSVPNKDTVEISAEWWAKLSGEEKELLMFHELGHCLLERGHTEELLSNGKPKSIMHPRLFFGYLVNRAYYLDELFKASNAAIGDQ